MPLDAIVQVSFDTDGAGNNEVRSALTGTLEAGKPESPFKKVGTTHYSCIAGDEEDIARALLALANAIGKRPEKIDHLSIVISKSTS
jgi:hypothetical protein